MRAANVEKPSQRSRYGTIKNLPTEAVAAMETLEETTPAGTEVAFKARVHAIRNMSSNLAFVLLRHQLYTVQAVLRSDEVNITRHMVRWAEKIPIESIVYVKGVVHTPVEKLQSTTYHDVELMVTDIFILSSPKSTLPFHHYGAPNTGSSLTPGLHQPHDVVSPTSTSARNSISSGESTYSAGGEQEGADELTEMKPSHQQKMQAQVPLAVRMANRVLDLRSPCSQGIFRIQSAVCQAFRGFLNDQGFIEIHTPKLLGGASESGASVFTVDYFGRRACLAQSPQLFKQMCICADFGRVYEVGPVFRAENSNTHRHLTEYTGLDLEMELTGTDYHEAMMLIDGLLKSIFEKLTKSHRFEIETIRKIFPSSEFSWLPETLILEYTKGVQILIDSGYLEENGYPPKVDDDLSTRGEIRLGALIKEKFGTDYYILDKFPAKVRPFYTMPDDKIVGASNSFDVFVRGQEIISGGQRVHIPEDLEATLARDHMETKGLEDYLESFRLAAPAHAGCGIGLERFVMLFLGLNDIRNASLFPRDPRSLRETTLHSDDLRHPEATTITRKHRTGDTTEFPPPLEKLIANYGDSTNTSWLDDRYLIWRDVDTGAAVGYNVSGERAIVLGDPLCEQGQFERVSSNFLAFIKSKKLKPVWLLVSHDFENILAHTFNWNTLSCCVESRIKGEASEAEKKVRQATRQDVKVVHFTPDEGVTAEWKQKAEAKIEAWKNSRTNKKQVHMTDVHPWQDEAHRDYFFVTDGHSELVAMVILAQLSKRHGYQLKWALDFPDAPSGSIEFGIMTAVKTYPASNFTFGASAVENLLAGSNIRGVKAKALETTYHSIVNNFNLLNKVEFRKKFGATNDERVWICYPRGNMGPRTIKSIVAFFGADNK